MRLTKGLCQLSRLLVKCIATGDWIGGHGFSASLAQSQ